MDDAPPLQIDSLRATINAELCIDVSGVTASPGDLIVVLGANGTGKTAFLEALLGLRPSETREVKLLGVAARRFDSDTRVRKRFGAQLQQVAFRGDSTVMEIMRIHGALYGPGGFPTAKLLQLGRLAHKRYGQLSGGEKRRVDLYVAIAHFPSLLVLDEPTAALDRNFATIIRSFLTRLRQHRSAVLLVSHAAEDVAMASRVLWLQDGRVTAFEPPAVLLSRELGEYRADVRTPSTEGMAALRAGMQDRPGIRVFWSEHSATFFGPASLESSLRELVAQHPVESYAFSRTSTPDLLWLTSRGTA